jgi:antitoxin (DNA-binding transcriptional repressor) of toxin-antitoxin stability system
MMHVTLEEAKIQLTDLVNAALSGETVIIQKDTTHQIQMLPLIQLRRTPQFGSAKGLIEMDDDFDAPLPDFEEYQQ